MTTPGSPTPGPAAGLGAPRYATAPNSPQAVRAGAPKAFLGARRQGGGAALAAPEAHRARSHSFRSHTLFHDAQVNNLEDCIELLAKGEDVNQAKGVAQLRPLHVAATCGSFEVASQLLNAGADMNVQCVCVGKEGEQTVCLGLGSTRSLTSHPSHLRDTHGLTPLMLTFKWRRGNYADLAALLLAAGANGSSTLIVILSTIPAQKLLSSSCSPHVSHPTPQRN